VLEKIGILARKYRQVHEDNVIEANSAVPVKAFADSGGGGAEDIYIREKSQYRLEWGSRFSKTD